MMLGIHGPGTDRKQAAADRAARIEAKRAELAARLERMSK